MKKAFIGENRDLVDPYVQVQFAGQKVRQLSTAMLSVYFNSFPAANLLVCSMLITPDVPFTVHYTALVWLLIASQ